jgi:hypothetical protein
MLRPDKTNLIHDVKAKGLLLCNDKYVVDLKIAVLFPKVFIESNYL